MINLKTVLLALLFATALSLATTASAEELPSPKEFYQPGFTIEEGKNTRSKEWQDTRKTRTNNNDREEIAQQTSRVRRMYQGRVKRERDRTSPGPLRYMQPKSEGIPVEAVSIILAGDDAEHLEHRYQEFCDLYEALNIPLADVFVVGDPRNIPPQFLSEHFSLPQGKGMLRPVRVLPSALQEISTAPTLMVHTSDGVILLEGYKDLHDRFTTDGEFVPPEDTVS